MNFFEAIDTWLQNHLTLVASVAVPLLAVALTGWISYLTTKANTKAQDQQRELNHQLKLADFRQAWINDMREDFAIYIDQSWRSKSNENVQAKTEKRMAQARIMMRMNPCDPDYQIMLDSLRRPFSKPEEDSEALVVVGQRILKREWERLKDDLKKVDGK